MVRPKTRLQTISTYLTYFFLLAFGITFIGVNVYYPKVCPPQPNAKEGRIYPTRIRGTDKVFYMTKGQKHMKLLPIGLFIAGLMTSYGIAPKE